MQQTEFLTGEIRPIECFREGWEAIRPNYWLIFIITVIGVVIGGVSIYILLGAMISGIYLCYFRALDGKDVSVEHLFHGFRFFWPSLLITVLMVGPFIAVIGLVYAPLLYAAMMGVRLTEEELFSMLSGVLVLDLIVAVVMVCLHTLIMFSYPLIVDRGLSGWRSVITSARAVWGNLKGVTGLWAASFAAGIIGYLALCVGVYFVIPLILAANVAAYRKVFPRLSESEDRPPAPDRYEGLADNGAPGGNFAK